MARGRTHYKPRTNKDTWQALKRLLLSILGITVVSATLLYVTIPLFSRINTIWGIFSPESGAPNEIDRIPPAPPYLKPLTSAVNEKNISLEGFSEPGAKAILYLNDEKIDETVVDKEGGFSFNNIELKKGKNTFHVQAEDKAENKSNPSKKLTVVYDNEPPELTIEEPAEGTTIEKEEDRKIEIKGVTEPKIRVTVNEFWARVDEEGKFSYQFRLEEGENQIKIVAEDEAGNKTEKVITVNYEPEEEEKEED